MRFDVVTLFPQMIESFFIEGVVGSALRHKHVEITLLNPRQYSEDKYKSVDDKVYGGGDGMVMTPQILSKCIEQIRSQGAQKVFTMCPQGQKLDQNMAKQLVQEKHIGLICGRYAGFDQRACLDVDGEISIGDYILSGGELAAAAVIDTVSRLVPGVLGNAASVHQDSFSDRLLEAPQFTRPEVWNGLQAPPVLLSGDHQKIEHWKKQISLLLTLQKRPDLLSKNINIGGIVEFWRQMSVEDKKVCGFEGWDAEEALTQIGKL